MQKVLFWHAYYISQIKNWRPPSSFLRYEQLNTKYRVFLQGFPVSMVTCYVTIMTASSSAIIAGTVTLLLGDKVF